MKNNKINIAELLKDCTKGMKLNCTMYKDVELDFIDENPEAIYPIHCLIKTNKGNNESVVFTDYGCSDTHPNAKCVIFPEGKTTWEGFIPPNKFKDGDILYIDCTENDDVYPHNKYIFILKEINDNKIHCYCYIDEINNYKKFDECWLSDKICNLRFATEEEKKKLFNTIKANGLQWNEDTKTLEKLIKPKFKVGDKIIYKDCKNKIKVINAILDNEYNLFGGGRISFKDQDKYELVPNKFDISTLVPFESKVLVRDSENQDWKPAIWGFYNNNAKTYPYATVGGNIYRYIIPYENNEHLMGTTNECDNYYKTWEE